MIKGYKEYENNNKKNMKQFRTPFCTSCSSFVESQGPLPHSLPWRPPAQKGRHHHSLLRRGFFFLSCADIKRAGNDGKGESLRLPPLPPSHHSPRAPFLSYFSSGESHHHVLLFILFLFYFLFFCGWQTKWPILVDILRKAVLYMILSIGFRDGSVKQASLICG